jgi:NADPH-dependent 2,4-dienoyl-CoA reductase/sulfur reductase-like enzyme
VRVEIDTEERTLTVDGVRLSLDVLAMLTGEWPAPPSKGAIYALAGLDAKTTEGKKDA